MGIWKTAGYVAGGICTVVALPVFGAVGSVTAAGALVGAAVGAGVRYAFDGDDTESAAESRGEARGRNQAKAQYDLEVQAIKEQYAIATEEFNKAAQYYDLVDALFRVGMACASRSGRDSAAEVGNLLDFIVGLSGRALPQRLHDRLEAIRNKPPTLKAAYARAHKVAPDSLALFDQVATLATLGAVDAAGQECLADWAQMRAA